MTTNRNYTSYSFKSVGSKRRVQSEEEVEIEAPPIGIKTPIRMSQGRGLFDMHTDLASQISDNFRNLIQTNHGERLGFYDFGANLQPLLFELGSEDGDIQAMQRIQIATAKWMPFISLDGMQIFVDKNNLDAIAQIGIRISYTVPAVDNNLRIMELILYMAG